MIAAASTNNVIGNGNGLPWHLPNDMRYFKNTTWGMPVLMGRKTFESMGNKRLPGRINIVVTHQPGWKAEGVVVANSLKDAFFVAEQTDCRELFVIGGGELFKELLPDAHRIYLTRVHTQIQGDVFFPDIDKNKFQLSWSKHLAADEKHAFDYTFERWEKGKK